MGMSLSHHAASMPAGQHPLCHHSAAHTLSFRSAAEESVFFGLRLNASASGWLALHGDRQDHLDLHRVTILHRRQKFVTSHGFHGTGPLLFAWTLQHANLPGVAVRRHHKLYFDFGSCDTNALRRDEVVAGQDFRRGHRWWQIRRRRDLRMSRCGCLLPGQGLETNVRKNPCTSF